jgi:hypothetical protein
VVHTTDFDQAHETMERVCLSMAILPV